MTIPRDRGARRTRRADRVLAAISMPLAMLANAAAASDFTWTGADAPSNGWSDALNWSPQGAPPQASGNNNLHFAGSTGLTNSNDIATPFLLNGLWFDSGAGAFDLNGHTITFVNNGALVAPSITQNNTAAVAVHNPLSIQQNLGVNVN